MSEITVTIELTGPDRTIRKIVDAGFTEMQRIAQDEWQDEYRMFDTFPRFYISSRSIPRGLTGKLTMEVGDHPIPR